MGLWWPPAATYMRPGASRQSRRYVFTGPGEVSSLVTDPPGTPVTPCIIISIVIIRKGEERRKKKREVLHLFRCYTHTHPAGAGSTLKGKRKKKADTNDGPTTKTAQRGKGTGGPPEPTYTAKRTWQKTGHTSKPHNTLRRSREGRVIRDQMGD